jgi:O-antigen/teichoic acid export membrane protein
MTRYVTPTTSTVESAPGVATSSVQQDVDTAPLLRGSYSLLLNTVATGLLGLAFWVLAARLFPSVTVGRDTVLLSVMIELSVLCQLDMDTVILRFLPDLGHDSRLALVLTYGLTTTAAVIAGSGFVLVAPSVSRGLGFLGDDQTLAIGFVVGLTLWGLFVLQDSALTAVRHAVWVPTENAAFGVLKLIALPVLLLVGVSHAVFLAWILPVAPLVLAVNLFLFARAMPLHSAAHTRLGDATSAIGRLGVRGAIRFVAGDYVATVLSQATVTALPLLVIGALGARQSAYFTIPFSVALTFDMLAAAASGPLLVESTLQPGRPGLLAALFLRRLAAPLIGGAVVAALAAPIVLAPFGHAYAQHGAAVLRLLLGASALRVLVVTFNASLKAQGRPGHLVVMQLLVFVAVLALAIPLANAHGIAGVAAAWLAGNVLACSYAAAILVGFRSVATR